MFRFSAQVTPLSSLPTLLGSPCAQQPGKVVQSYPLAIAQRPTAIGGCPTPGGYLTPRGCPTPRGECRTPPGDYRTPRVSGVQNMGFGVEDLHLGMAGFDPSQEPLKSQVLTKLGLPQHAIVGRLAANCGGLNEGMWTVQDPSSSQSLVLKLVRCRRAYGMPSEADRFAKLYQEHPSIANDPTVAFPIKIFKCRGQAGDNSHDLIVMRTAKGQPLGDVLAHKQSSGGMHDSMRILRQVGMFLARFHKSYRNKQHGDFQPSNIFYDVASGTFTMIDIAGLGDPTSAEGDVAHFCQSLRILSSSYGQQFYSEGKRNFEEGYRSMP